MVKYYFITSKGAIQVFPKGYKLKKEKIRNQKQGIYA